MAEIALAVVLLVTSGLMVRSLGQLFDAQVGLSPGRRADCARRAGVRRVRESADRRRCGTR